MFYLAATCEMIEGMNSPMYIPKKMLSSSPSGMPDEENARPNSEKTWDPPVDSNPVYIIDYREGGENSIPTSQIKVSGVGSYKLEV